MQINMIIHDWQSLEVFLSRWAAALFMAFVKESMLMLFFLLAKWLFNKTIIHEIHVGCGALI